MPNRSIPMVQQDSAQVLGTVHGHRGRWSPFLPENDMLADRGVLRRRFPLSRTGGRHGDGVYAVRFTTGRDCHRGYAFDHRCLDARGWPALIGPDRSDCGYNLMFRVEQDGDYELMFDPGALRYDIQPRPAVLTEIRSMQLNGFVWDDEADAQKFDETLPGHEMARSGDWWELDVRLKVGGGMARRADGVYQFLFSCNRDEDWGLGGLNAAPGRLAGGVGFSSSRGTSRHSALTIQVMANGRYRFRANPFLFAFEVVPLDGQPAPLLANTLDSVQLLGTVYQDRPYDPTDRAKDMVRGDDGRYRKQLDVQAGIYAINFAIGRELFLDTMGCGAFYEGLAGGALGGRAWHGKPDEANIFFRAAEQARLEFVYDPRTDEFLIQVPGDDARRPLTALTAVDTLQLVGSFDSPLASWAPEAAANDMEPAGPGRFRRRVMLEAGRRYQYKYNANRWAWLWVFADYEYDGYTRLTTHGDPPALEFTPAQAGEHEFFADLEAGTYGVRPVPPAPHG